MTHGGLSCRHSTMGRYEDLRAWRRAMALVEEVYRVTTASSFDRDWGLRSQLRRAAVSVASNIVEGYERGSRREFTRGLTIAKGSCGEVQVQLLLAIRVGHVSADDARVATDLAAEVSALLARLRASVRRQATLKE
ncbi:MAG: four helix bundle protein [Gemmatimonadales bacterium]